MNKLQKLGIGTVQWGLRYGIANRHGIPSAQTISAILTEARHLGVALIDTAALYGASEEILGSNHLDGFHVVTKTPQFQVDVISPEHAAALVATFEQSLLKLSRPAVYGLLIHRAADLLAPGGDLLMAAMRELQERRLVQRIGVSAYDAWEIEALLDRYTPDLVQLPFNILDRGLLVGGQLERLKDRGVEIHARSAFLQGLLLMPPEQVPGYFQPIRPLLARLHASAREQGMTPAQAALCFVRDVPFIDVVVVGVESLEQFRECAQNFCIDGKFEADDLTCSDQAFTNPARWRQ